MNPKRQMYVRVSGDLIIELLKKYGNLPKDTEMVAVVETPKDFIDSSNTIRIAITSEEFPEIFNGYHIPIFSFQQEEYKNDKQ